MITDSVIHQFSGFWIGEFILGLTLKLRVFDKDRDQAATVDIYVLARDACGLFIANKFAICLDAFEQCCAYTAFMSATDRGWHCVTI